MDKLTYAEAMASRDHTIVIVRRMPYQSHRPDAVRSWSVLSINPPHWFHRIEHFGFHGTEAAAVADAQDIATRYGLTFVGVMHDTHDDGPIVSTVSPDAGPVRS